MSSVAFLSLALVAYLAASAFYGANLALKRPAYLRLGRVCFIAGVALHTAAVGAFCVQTRQSPFANLYGTLSVAGWAVALLYLPVEFLARSPALGALTSPICCVLLFGALAKARYPATVSAALQTRIVSLHVLLVLFSFALFILAACCAVFYIWQYGLLKHPDRRALFRRLPPLETVDSAAFHLVAFALPLLTLGLALGIVRVLSEGRAHWYTDPHVLISLVAWVVYCVYLSLRTVGGWRGARLNYLLVAGLAVTLALYLLPSQTHRFAG